MRVVCMYTQIDMCDGLGTKQQQQDRRCELHFASRGRATKAVDLASSKGGLRTRATRRGLRKSDRHL